MAEKWIKTQFPGVRYRESKTKNHNGKPDRYFTIRYKFDGVLKEEGLGWASNNWNAQKASLTRSELTKNHKIGEGPSTLNEKRQLAKDKKGKEEAEKELALKGAVTFSQYFTNTYFPATKIEKAQKSLQRESGLLQHWISPIIGELPFGDITHQHLELIKQKMLAAEQSPRSVRYALAVIRQVFNHARFVKFYEGPSPIENVKFPQADNNRRRFLTAEEATLLLKELKTRSLQLYEIALFSLRTGARADEIFSLKWGDLDFNEDTMTLWDTKNKKTRLAWMTSDIRQMLLEKRSADFSQDEFQARKPARKLYKAIKKDIPGFLADTQEPINWSNKLLETVSLYELFLKRQPKINYSETITELVKIVKVFKEKSYGQLKDTEKDSLKRLNRLLIEETYTLLTPKNPQKTTRNNSDYIFTDRNNNKIVTVSNAFDRAVDETGLNKDVTDRRMKVVFHTLRHTYASWLVEKEVNLYLVKELMGHSSLTMTERYSHVGKNALSLAVKKLEKIEINLDQETEE
jgi:integrase